MYLTFIRWLSYLKVKTPLINKMSKIQGKVTGTDPFIKISDVSNPIILLEIHRYNVFLEFFVLCQTFWILLASSACLGLVFTEIHTFSSPVTPLYRCRVQDIMKYIQCNDIYVYLWETRDKIRYLDSLVTVIAMNIPHANVPVCVNLRYTQCLT